MFNVKQVPVFNLSLTLLNLVWKCNIDINICLEIQPKVLFQYLLSYHKKTCTYLQSLIMCPHCKAAALLPYSAWPFLEGDPWSPSELIAIRQEGSSSVAGRLKKRRIDQQPVTSPVWSNSLRVQLGFVLRRGGGVMISAGRFCRCSSELIRCLLTVNGWLSCSYSQKFVPLQGVMSPLRAHCS